MAQGGGDPFSRVRDKLFRQVAGWLVGSSREREQLHPCRGGRPAVGMGTAALIGLSVCEYASACDSIYLRKHHTLGSL